MSLDADVLAARLGATLEMFAANKKARAGLRWVVAAALEAGCEPRVGPLSFYKLQAPKSTGTTLECEPEATAGQQRSSRKRKRRPKPRAKRGALDGLVDYYNAQLCEEGVGGDFLPPAPCAPPPLEPDMSELLTGAAAPRSYAEAARSSPQAGSKRTASPTTAVLQSPAKVQATRGGLGEQMPAFLAGILEERGWADDLVDFVVNPASNPLEYHVVRVPRSCCAVKHYKGPYVHEVLRRMMSPEVTVWAKPGTVEDYIATEIKRYFEPAAPPEGEQGGPAPKQAPKKKKRGYKA